MRSCFGAHHSFDSCHVLMKTEEDWNWHSTNILYKLKRWTVIEVWWKLLKKWCVSKGSKHCCLSFPFVWTWFVINRLQAPKKMKESETNCLIFRMSFDHAAQRACFFEVICSSYMLPAKSSSLAHLPPYGDLELRKGCLKALSRRACTQNTLLGGRFFCKNKLLSWSSINARFWRSKTIYFTFFI